MFPFPNPMTAGGRSQFTTWNPADAAAGISLSNGNLTATASGAPLAVRGVTSKSSGKWGLTYTYGGGNAAAIGIADSTASLTAAWNTGSHSVSFLGGNLRQGATSLQLGLTNPTGTSVVDMLFDLTAGLCWLRVDAGLWNNSGTADPAAGIGGIAFTLAGNGPAWFPYMNEATATVTVTMNPFVVSYPGNFKAWDA